MNSSVSFVPKRAIFFAVEIPTLHIEQHNHRINKQSFLLKRHMESSGHTYGDSSYPKKMTVDLGFFGVPITLLLFLALLFGVTLITWRQGRFRER